MHVRKAGFVEGEGRRELLRYLRHEMGHVVNYAYQLYDEGDWVRLFGPITKTYLEDYRPSPFSRRYVRHLPGWYAQKHPDEDWAETFALWMTPALDWRAEYATQPLALAKLEYCDRRMNELRDAEPIVTENKTEEDVRELGYSVEEYYGHMGPRLGRVPGRARRRAARHLRGARARRRERVARPGRAPGAADRARSGRLDLPLDGHFPERTRSLLRHLAERAEALQLAYDPTREAQANMA
jgi:hypothetical protein